mmetsp:Transcript_35737/g.69421  ORF Transcript_35737/g.69421 Transcript_35737/m.69421 type:complete len:300 (-) Transcript_35737:69-968(-)
MSGTKDTKAPHTSDAKMNRPGLQQGEEKAKAAEAVMRESSQRSVPKPKHCIVALDHTSKSDAVLNWCANFLKNEPGFKVTFLNVYSASSYVPYSNATGGHATVDSISLRNRAVEYGSDMLKRLQRKSIEMGFSATEAKLLAQTPMTGTTKETILEYVKKHNPDMLVCGSRGLGPMGRLFVGSVSDYLVHNCACTVVVVKENAQDQEMKDNAREVLDDAQAATHDPSCDVARSKEDAQLLKAEVPTLTDDTGRVLCPGLEILSPAPPARLQKGIAKLREDEDPSKVFVCDEERIDAHCSC